MDAMTEIWRNVTHESRKKRVCMYECVEAREKGGIREPFRETDNVEVSEQSNARVHHLNHTHESHFIRLFRTADENR
jgi:hypothetical protein